MSPWRLPVWRKRQCLSQDHQQQKLYTVRGVARAKSQGRNISKKRICVTSGEKSSEKNFARAAHKKCLSSMSSRTGEVKTVISRFDFSALSSKWTWDLLVFLIFPALFRVMPHIPFFRSVHSRVADFENFLHQSNFQLNRKNFIERSNFFHYFGHKNHW